MSTSESEIDPGKIIADAQQEASEAEQLVSTLEEAVKSGDDTVTFEEVEKARGLLSFVKLRQEAATRKAAKARAAARLAACAALHAEITDHATGDGAELAEQLEAVTDAIRAFADTVEARNTRVLGYRARAVELGIPEHIHPTAPPAVHGRVGLTAGGGPGGIVGVMAGRRRLEQINRDVFLNRALDLLAREDKFKHLDFVDAGTDLFGDLASIDAETAGPAGNHFYRGPNGGVIAKDDPFTPDEIQRMGLTVVSKAKAYGE
ncbi:hypothetical protein [Pseudarthrobacter sp. S9]|uniref:hypothetical protein n=1 Tax=Pseudarthrobacter sp. S9 TaxID=3418421 RepID=UPI003CFDBB49